MKTSGQHINIHCTKCHATGTTKNIAPLGYRTLFISCTCPTSANIIPSSFDGQHELTMLLDMRTLQKEHDTQAFYAFRDLLIPTNQGYLQMAYEMHKRHHATRSNLKDVKKLMTELSDYVETMYNRNK